MSAKHRHYRHHCYSPNRGCLGQFQGLCSCTCALCRHVRKKQDIKTNRAIAKTRRKSEATRADLEG